VEDQRLVVSQEGRQCEFRVSTTLVGLDSSGGERTVQVEASSAQCRWTAVAQESWIAIVSGAEGTGNGAVTLRVGAAAGSPRAGTLTIAGHGVRVDQGTGCTYSIANTAFAFGAVGGRGEIPVSTAAGCSWTAQASVPWMSVLGDPTSSGPGVLAFRVDATDGPTRTGTITIAGHVATITQSPGCAYVVEPMTYAAAATGGSAVIAVRAGAGCPWTASAAADWISFTSGRAGEGPGEIRIAVGANPGPARSATLSVASQTVSVTQASGCNYTVTPSSLSASAAATTGSIQVGAAQACAWSATSGASWVTITGGSSGSGDGAVQFSIAANSGPARDTSLSIGGRTVPVAQASGCTYSISPGVQDVGSGSGTGAASIATGVGCPWTASSNAAWISVATPAGTGPAQVSFSVMPNSGPPRSGTITLAGHLFTVNQASSCTWALVPPSHVYGPDGGNGAILVIVSGACTWTAVSNAAWITLTSGESGTGGGLVQFVVASNTSAARSGTMTIAGQRYDVTQAGR
jgi:Putative binding domain, N-terminal/Viral BACON domain